MNSSEQLAYQMRRIALGCNSCVQSPPEMLPPSLSTPIAEAEIQFDCSQFQIMMTPSSSSSSDASARSKESAGMQSADSYSSRDSRNSLTRSHCVSNLSMLGGTSVKAYSSRQATQYAPDEWGYFVDTKDRWMIVTIFKQLHNGVLSQKRHVQKRRGCTPWSRKNVNLNEETTNRISVSKYFFS